MSARSFPKTFLCFCALITIAAATPLPAATIHVSAGCGTTIAVPVNNTAWCKYFLGEASASVVVTSPSDIEIKARITPPGPPPPTTGASASASYSSLVNIVFTGGTGSGVYIPCLFVLASRSGQAAYASATFGPVHVFSGYAVPELCDPRSPEVMSIPFIFGVPQTQAIHLGGSVIAGQLAGYSGGATASLSGFRVFDEQRNEIRNVSWTVTEVPEPSVSVAVPIVLVLAWIVRRQRQPEL